MTASPAEEDGSAGPRRAPPPSSTWAALGGDDDLIAPSSGKKSDALTPPAGIPKPAARAAGPPPPATKRLQAVPPPAAPRDPFADIVPRAPAAPRDPFADVVPGAPAPRPTGRLGPAPDPFADDPFEQRPKAIGGPVAEAPPRKVELRRSEPAAPALEARPREKAPPGRATPPEGESLGPPTERQRADERPLPLPASAATGQVSPAEAGLVPAAERPRISLPPPACVVSGSSASISQSRLEGPPGARRRMSPAMVVALAVGTAALVIVPALVWIELDTMHADRARLEFMASVDGYGPEEALARAEALPTRAREDPRVQQKLAALREALRRVRARDQALQLLAGVAGAPPADGLVLCNRAIAVDDTCAQAYVTRAGLRLAGASDPEALAVARREALADLSAAVAKDPSSAPARHGRARLLAAGDDGERSQAEVELEALAEADPLSGWGALARGRLELLRGRPEAALSHLDAAVQRGVPDGEAQAARAAAHLLRGDGQAAMADADAAVDAAPRSARALALRASARLGALKDERAARKDVDAALALAPLEPLALALRADLRLLRGPGGELQAAPGELDQAKKDAELAAKLDGSLALPLLVLAELAAHRRDVAEGLRLVSQAVQRDPGDARGRLLRARLRLRDGDENALQDVEVVLQRLPDDPHALTLRAAVLLAQRHFDRACADLDRVLGQRELPEAYYYRGVATLLGRRPAARAAQDLTRSLDLAPGNGDAHYHRALASVELERWDEAVQDLDQAERLRKPTSGYGVHDLLKARGDIAYARRDWKAAHGHYTKWRDLAPAGASARQMIARRLEELQARLSTKQDAW